MVPQTVAAVVAFALLIVPGITFELLRQTRRPSFEQTTLEELGRIILASAGFGASAFLVLCGVSLVVPGAILDLSSLSAQGPGRYWRLHPELVIWSISAQVALSTALVLWVHRSLNHPNREGLALRAVNLARRALRHETGQQIERVSVWRALFRDVRPPGASTRVTVIKKDGTMITGTVAAYTTNSGGGHDRDLALSGPIEIMRPSQSLEKVPDHWPLLILPAADIAEILVTWPPRCAGMQ